MSQCMSRPECGLPSRRWRSPRRHSPLGPFFSHFLFRSCWVMPNVFCFIFGPIPLLIALVTYGESHLTVMYLYARRGERESAVHLFGGDGVGRRC